MHPCLAAPSSLRGLGTYEWHPFSVSSAPDDEFVTLHIKAVGDWTNNLMALVKKTYEGRPKLSQVGVMNQTFSKPQTAHTVHVASKNNSNNCVTQATCYQLTNFNTYVGMLG